MNKIFALLVFMVGLAGCEFYTYETQMIPPKRPHFTIDSYYGPEWLVLELMFVNGAVLLTAVIIEPV
jgi:hypothetical protein